jgi:hypothetical protein
VLISPPTRVVPRVLILDCSAGLSTTCGEHDSLRDDVQHNGLQEPLMVVPLPDIGWRIVGDRSDRLWIVIQDLLMSGAPCWGGPPARGAGRRSWPLGYLSAATVFNWVPVIETINCAYAR